MQNFQDYKKNIKGKKLFENSKVGIRFYYPKNYYYLQTFVTQSQRNIHKISLLNISTKDHTGTIISSFYLGPQDTKQSILQYVKTVSTTGYTNPQDSLFKEKLNRNLELNIIETQGVLNGMPHKCWSGVIITHSMVYIFVQENFQDRFDTKLVRELLQTVEFYQPLDYSVIQYINPTDGLIFQLPSPSFDIFTSGLLNGQLFSSMTPQKDTILCFTCKVKDLEEGLSLVKSKHKGTPMESFILDKIILNGGHPAYILTFENPEVKDVFLEMLVVKNGTLYDIHCYNVTTPMESYIYSFTTTTFSNNLKMKEHTFRVTNFNQVEYTIDFPTNGYITEQPHDPYFMFHHQDMTTSIAIEEKIEYQNAEKYRQLFIDLYSQRPNFKTGASVVKIVSTDLNYGKFLMIQILYVYENSHNNKENGLISIIPHNDKIISINTSCQQTLYDKKRLEDMKRIHQSIRIKGGPDNEANFKKGMYSCNHFEDCVFVLDDNKVPIEYYQVGLQVNHSRSWKGKYFAQLPEFFIIYNKDNIQGMIHVFGFLQDIGLEEYVKMKTPPNQNAKNFKKTESKIDKLKAYILEYDLLQEDGTYIPIWQLITFTNLRGYTFNCEGNFDFTELKQLYFTAKFFLPLTSGRIQYCNTEHQFRMLLPGIDFDTQLPNEKNQFLLSTPPLLDLTHKAHVKGYTHQEKDLKTLIEKRRNFFSYQFAEKFTEISQFKGYDLENGHIFNAIQDDHIFSEFCFERNNKLLSIQYLSPKLFMAEEHNHDIFFYEIRTSDIPQNECIRYDCLNYNFSIDTPMYGKVLEFMESENIYSAIDVVDLEHGDGSYTIIRKEKIELNGTSYDIMNEIKTRMFAGHCKIDSMNYERRHSQYNAYDIEISNFYDPINNIKKKCLSTTILVNPKTLLVIDTGIDQNLYKEEMMEKWKNIHKSFKLVIYLTPFDKHLDWCLPMSQPIILPTDFNDTLIYCSSNETKTEMNN